MIPYFLISRVVQWGDDLQREHELHLLSVTGQLPVFITDFPAAIKPFYARTLDSDTDIVGSFKIFIPSLPPLSLS